MDTWEGDLCCVVCMPDGEEQRLIPGPVSVTWREQEERVALLPQEGIRIYLV